MACERCTCFHSLNCSLSLFGHPLLHLLQPSLTSSSSNSNSSSSMWAICFAFSVRGLCIAMEQYSSLCGWVLGLILGGFDIVEADVQDREQVDSGEKVEARERERRRRQNKETTNERSNMLTSWIMDDTQMEWMRALRHLEPQYGVCTKWKYSRKTRVRCICPHYTPSVVDRSVYTARRLQWIAIDCERNQL